MSIAVIIYCSINSVVSIANINRGDIVHGKNKFDGLTANINSSVNVYGKTILVVSAADGGDNMCNGQF